MMYKVETTVSIKNTQVFISNKARQYSEVINFICDYFFGSTNEEEGGEGICTILKVKPSDT